MKTEIISAFPATGKSYFAERSSYIVLDSDSSKFSWIRLGERHPNFPQNYIEHIKAYLGEVDYILVSSHQEIRDALVAERLPFMLVYPADACKAEYLDRCLGRGSPETFLNMLEANWEKFLGDCQATRGCTHRVLETQEYLSDVFETSCQEFR